MKDERNHQGAADKSFSERIRIVDANYILCKKNWTRTRSGTGSYGRQAGRWQTKYSELEIFKIIVHRKIRLFASFNQGTASLLQ